MDNKPSVLIVDDDNKLRKTLTDILGAKGFIPMDVAEGKTALKIIKESAPAVALIDLKLEDMSGLKLMEKIKALSPNTECIMITGHASQASAIEAVNLGAFSFMLKPYDVEQLLVTIRRAIEKQEVLKTLKAQYKGIPVPTYTWQWDGEDLVLVDYNNAAEEITHGKIVDFLGKKARDMYQDTPEILEELFRCFNKKTPIQREMQYQYKSIGESKHLAVKYAFTPPNLVLVHTEDITERVQAEEALRESKEQYRSVVEDSPGLISRFLPDGTITFVNQEYCRFFGRKYDEVIGTNIQSTITEENKEIVMSSFDSISAESPIRSIEVKNIKQDGETRWIRWTDHALFNEKGQVMGYQSFGEDITEMIEAEQAMKQEQEKAQKYLDIAEVIIIALNPKGEITLVNQKGNLILGYQEDELIGKNWFDTCVPERERKERKQVFRKIIASEAELDVYDNENTVLTRSGEERTIAWHDTLIWDEKGHNVGSLSSGEDITERKRAEQLLNALNRAAVSMGTAQTQQEIFNAVARELEQLDISCMLFPLDQTQGKLTTEYISYKSALLNAAEKLAGIKHGDFSFRINAVDIYREVVREKKTFFSDSSEHTFQQILPKLAKKLTAQIVKLLRIQKSISAPLMVDGQVIGVFSIQSDNLTQEDIPTATAFADQLSSAWNKIELLQNLRKTVEGTIHTIAATVEARDPYTAGHQTRVADLAGAIASEMHLSNERVEGINMAGVIHDLGKINVPAEILSKPGKISELEYEIIKNHSRIGFDLLKEIEFPWPIAEIVLQHHEMIDGSGYPQGLKGDEILLEARILSIADTVEAMSFHRPYRPALGIEKALEQIRKDKGTLFDPVIVNVCLNLFKQGYKLPEG